MQCRLNLVPGYGAAVNYPGRAVCRVPLGLAVAAALRRAEPEPDRHKKRSPSCLDEMQPSRALVSWVAHPERLDGEPLPKQQAAVFEVVRAAEQALTYAQVMERITMTYNEVRAALRLLRKRGVVSMPPKAEVLYRVSDMGRAVALERGTCRGEVLFVLQGGLVLTLKALVARVHRCKETVRNEVRALIQAGLLESA